MARLTKEQIKAAEPVLLRETVSVPEWGGDVVVQEMMGWQRDAFDQYLVDRNDKSKRNPRKHDPGMMAKIVAMHVIDEDGNLMYGPEDEEWISKKSNRSLRRVYDAAVSVSQLWQKGVDDAEKNSDSGQSLDSGSSSAAPTEPTTDNSSDS